jgi:cbb3-type cytochrome oxidase maturation protein
MTINYLLVVLGIGVFIGAVWALFWAVDAGQFEDLERQGAQILGDDMVPGGESGERVVPGCDSRD